MISAVHAACHSLATTMAAPAHIAVAAALPCPAATGDPYPKSTEEVCKAADAVLLASIGGCAVLRCAVLCCAVEESARRPMPCCWRPSAGAMRCAALRCAVLCCAGLCYEVCCAVVEETARRPMPCCWRPLAGAPCCAVLRCAVLRRCARRLMPCCWRPSADALRFAACCGSATLCCMLWQQNAQPPTRVHSCARPTRTPHFLAATSGTRCPAPRSMSGMLLNRSQAPQPLPSTSLSAATSGTRCPPRSIPERARCPTAHKHPTPTPTLHFLQLQVGLPAERAAPREGPAAPARLAQRLCQPAARGCAAAAGRCLHPQARGVWGSRAGHSGGTGMLID